MKTAQEIAEEVVPPAAIGAIGYHVMIQEAIRRDREDILANIQALYDDSWDTMEITARDIERMIRSAE